MAPDPIEPSSAPALPGTNIEGASASSSESSTIGPGKEDGARTYQHTVNCAHRQPQTYYDPLGSFFAKSLAARLRSMSILMTLRAKLMHA